MRRACLAACIARPGPSRLGAGLSGPRTRGQALPLQGLSVGRVGAPSSGCQGFWRTLALSASHITSSGCSLSLATSHGPAPLPSAPPVASHAATTLCFPVPQAAQAGGAHRRHQRVCLCAVPHLAHICGPVGGQPAVLGGASQHGVQHHRPVADRGLWRCGGWRAAGSWQAVDLLWMKHSRLACASLPAAGVHNGTRRRCAACCKPPCVRL